MNRRFRPLLWPVLGLFAVLAATAAEDRVTFESLRERARELAAQIGRAHV